VTLGVSAALLLLLAQFRFPEERAAQQVPIAAPLERLAARATYDELARIIATVDTRVSPSVLVLEFQSIETAGPAAGELLSRLGPALRVRDDMVVASMQPGEQVAGIVGQPGALVELVARDDVRGLGVVQVPAIAAPTLAVADDPAPGSPARYVAIVEASRSGASVRPVYLGKPDAVPDVRWPQPLLSLGGVLTASGGSFVFTLEGAFVGMTSADRGLPALVPASLLLTAANELARGQSRQRGDLGIGWQRLTPALARATGATTGVVVALVDPNGPAANHLQSGDVVQSINGVTIRAVADARVVEAALQPGAVATLQVNRGEQPARVTLVARQEPPRALAAGSDMLGLVLRPVADGLAVTRVTPESAADAAGLVAGDVITHVDRDPVGPSTNLTRAWEDAESGRAFLLTVARSNAVVVLALEKP
jgi:hypothetical protein